MPQLRFVRQVALLAICHVSNLPHLLLPRIAVRRVREPISCVSALLEYRVDGNDCECIWQRWKTRWWKQSNSIWMVVRTWLLGIHALTQFLAGSEVRNKLGRHRNAYACLWIAPCSWGPMVDYKGAKASYLDSSTARQCAGYRIKDFIDRLL